VGRTQRKVLIGITGAGIGGAQGVVWDLLSRLDGEKYELTLACPPTGDLVERVRGANQGGRRAPIALLPVNTLVRRIDPPRDAISFLRLLRAMSGHRFDIVHLHSSKMGVLGRFAGALAGVPAVFFTAHGWQLSAARSATARAALASVERLAAAVTTRVVCVSEADWRTAVRWRLCPQDNLAVIRNGVGAGPSGPGRLRAELGLDPDRLVVGTVMRLAPPKRPEVLVQATAQLVRRCPVPFVTVIVGDGPLMAGCRRLAGELGVSDAVRFLGERGDARALVNDFDVFTLFSSAEGLPLAVIEAMYAGKPVVASAVGGVPELVLDGQTGFLAGTADPQAAAQFIAGLLRDGDRRREMGDAGARRARALFSVDRMVREYEQLYDSAALRG